MKRRSSLQQLIYGATMLAGASAPIGVSRMLVPEVQAKPIQHLRPPGASENDKVFVSNCIGCGLCGEVCPPRCIAFHARDGGDMANTPFINPEEKACILCGKCMAVCPTEALIVTPIRDINMGISQIDRAACYPWVDKGICGACVSICPLGSDAIAFEMWNQYRPYIKDGCVGCGLCVEVCPHPSLPIWVVERSKGSDTHYTDSDSNMLQSF